VGILVVTAVVAGIAAIFTVVVAIPAKPYVVVCLAQGTETLTPTIFLEFAAAAAVMHKS